MLRSGGLRVVIYVDDHEPAHVHLVGDGEAKIDLGVVGGEPSLVWSKGFSAADLRRGWRLVRDHRDELMARWEDIHG